MDTMAALNKISDKQNLKGAVNNGSKVGMPINRSLLLNFLSGKLLTTREYT